MISKILFIKIKVTVKQSSNIEGDTNKNTIMSSSKSSRDIQKKEGGPDSCFGK